MTYLNKIIIGIVMLILISSIAIAEKKYLEALEKGDKINIGGEEYTVEEIKINRYQDNVEIKLSNGGTISGRTKVELADIARNPKSYAEYTPAEEPTEPEKEPIPKETPEEKAETKEESTPKEMPTETTTDKEEKTVDLGEEVIIGKKDAAERDEDEFDESIIGEPGWRDYMHWRYHTEDGKTDKLTYDEWSHWQQTQYIKAAEKRTPVTAQEILYGVTRFLAYYDQYSGFARFGSLFFTNEQWEQRREKINQLFCDTILLGGTQCWTSRICDTQLYPLVPRSVFAGRTPSGERQATASIQAEKSLPILAVDDTGKQITLRLYKITYAINNPYEEQELKYNVQLRTADEYKINWFSEHKNAPGQRTEANPLLEYGRNDYIEACLVFTPAIIDYQNYHGRRTREWCTPIIEYTGTATKPYPTASDEPETTPEEPEQAPDTGGLKPGI